MATRRTAKDAKAAKRARTTKASAPARKAPAKRPAKKPGKAKAPKARAKPPAGKVERPAAKGVKYPGAHVRLRVPMATYEPNKDAFKAPLKAEGLAWQYLGPGQGRYHDAKVSIFAKFGEAGVDYSLRGDEARVAGIVAKWRALGAADVTEQAKAEEESEAVKAWKLEMPVRRAGEPQGFFDRRIAEWRARAPSGAGGSS